MNTSDIRGFIILTVVAQFLWFFILPTGNRLAPRSPEMAQAVRAYETNRSSTTKAAMWEQVRRDDLRDSHQKEVLFSLMLLADVAAIYLFWNCGTKKTAA